MDCCSSRPGKSVPLGFPVREVKADAYAAQDLEALEELYGKAKGQFLVGFFGTTNFLDQGPPDGPVAVLSHGLGTKMAVFDGPIVEGLLAAGFRVIQYSFYGHGWSLAKDDAQDWDQEMFLTQARELLDHLLQPLLPVKLWVGHSTGGVVGVLLAAAGIRKVLDFALIAPAFWANKPAIAKVGDMVPSFLNWLGGFKSMEFLTEDAYTDNLKVALAKDGDKYIHQDVFDTGVKDIKDMFRLHPQAPRAILRTSLYFLRMDLQAEYLKTFQKFAEQHKDGRICLVWGEQDVVVPFQEAAGCIAWHADRIELAALDRLGHECVIEDRAAVGKAISEFAKRCKS